VRELVERRGYYDFVKRFWTIADPTVDAMRDNWHIGAIAEHLEAVHSRQITNLVINIPPGHGKTMLGTILFPAWTFTREPTHKFLTGSFDLTRLRGDSIKCRTVVESPLYRAAWPEIQTASAAQRPRTKLEWYTTQGGTCYSCSTGQSPTGRHFWTHIIDDPTAPRSTLADLEHALTWHDSVLSTRWDKNHTSAEIVIMQRIAHNDLAGVLLNRGFSHLCLPAEYVPNAIWDRGSPLPKADRRTDAGAPLFPQLFGDYADVKKRLVVSRDREAQLQQNPTPDQGGFIERAWFDQRWNSLDDLGNKQFWVVCQSWDLGFKGGMGRSKTRPRSRVCGALWVAARKGDRVLYYPIDERIGHWSYSETKAQFIAAQSDPLWRLAQVKLVEDKANGPALISDLRDDISGLQAVSVSESKEARLLPHTPKMSERLIVPPADDARPWARDWVDEHVFFPYGSYDDRVDTTTQALDYLTSHTAKLADSLRRMGLL